VLTEPERAIQCRPGDVNHDGYADLVLSPLGRSTQSNCNPRCNSQQRHTLITRHRVASEQRTAMLAFAGWL
ncbi:MAG: FG-GAP repeat protein, partial [Bradyrhizobium sp.]|nr:FG-GAP repeat protein [Bradyrhizobium sp.]